MVYGNIALITLVIFNSLFLFSFLWSIVVIIISRIKSKTTKTKQTEESKPVHFCEYNQQYFNREFRIRTSTQFS